MDEEPRQALARAIALKRKLVALKSELDQARHIYHRLYRGLANPCDMRIGAASPPGYGLKDSLALEQFPDPQAVAEKLFLYQQAHRELEKLKRSVSAEALSLIEGSRPSC